MEGERRTAEPRSSRPQIPYGYGVPANRKGMLPWSWARERLEQAPVYWVATTRPDGRPHVMPTWGAWVADRLYVEGSSQTRRARNIARNPEVVAHVERGDDAVIVEGRAERMRELDDAFAARVLGGFAKYRASHGYQAEAASWREGGLWEIRPRLVFGWSQFPRDTTRWHFEDADRRS